MKKGFLTILLLLLCWPCHAAVDTMDGQAIGDLSCAIADCSGAKTCTGSTGCVKRETFDGATLCYSGFTSNCDNSWGYAANTVDFDNATSPAPLQGTYSLLISSGANNKAFLEWTGAGTIYFGTMVNCSAFPCNLYLEDAIDGTKNCTFQLYNTTTMVSQAYGGTSQNTTVDVATGTTYYIKIKSVTGSGSNASCTPYISSDGSTWTTGTASTNGTFTSDSDTFHIYDQTVTYDDIRISTTNFDY